jgi:hypothetical protein
LGDSPSVTNVQLFTVGMRMHPHGPPIPFSQLKITPAPKLGAAALLQSVLISSFPASLPMSVGSIEEKAGGYSLKILLTQDTQNSKMVLDEREKTVPHLSIGDHKLVLPLAHPVETEAVKIHRTQAKTDRDIRTQRSTAKYV